ncbi:DUF5634 family protein [Bacillus sp. RD4P76]|uniref:DUF5634 family protein n=1 Tax=Bacillus suaedaesalsae TaxID=2810349 RepID=A0ABS2DP24_9BACI|nr:DUF5634 family protein [Bacillus suaedaesalsae]
MLADFIHSLEPMLEKYDLDDIGIYEEEGQGSNYFMGYTIRKDGKAFMINRPYVKNENKELALEKDEWTIQTDEGDEVKGIQSMEEVFEKINNGILH